MKETHLFALTSEYMYVKCYAGNISTLVGLHVYNFVDVCLCVGTYVCMSQVHMHISIDA